jgi:quercetin dioxygenase-like cupin family protein
VIGDSRRRSTSTQAPRYGDQSPSAPLLRSAANQSYSRMGRICSKSRLWAIGNASAAVEVKTVADRHWSWNMDAKSMPGVSLEILQEMDRRIRGHVTVIVELDVAAGTAIRRHMHPGVELAYVVEGEAELAIDGQPHRVVGAGEAFQVPTNTAHSVVRPWLSKRRRPGRWARALLAFGSPRSCAGRPPCSPTIAASIPCPSGATLGRPG